MSVVYSNRKRSAGNERQRVEHASCLCVRLLYRKRSAGNKLAKSVAAALHAVAFRVTEADKGCGMKNAMQWQGL